MKQLDFFSTLIPEPISDAFSRRLEECDCGFTWHYRHVWSPHRLWCTPLFPVLVRS